MWCEIRRHTLRHLYRGYWSALRVERLRQNRCGAGEMTRHLVLGHAEATASVITGVIWVAVGWFPFTEVARPVSPSSVMPRQQCRHANSPATTARQVRSAGAAMRFCSTAATTVVVSCLAEASTWNNNQCGATKQHHHDRP